MGTSEKTTHFSLTGGSYALIGIGVGLAAASWTGTGTFMVAISGLFWPVTLAYWFAQALHILGTG